MAFEESQQRQESDVVLSRFQYKLDEFGLVPKLLLSRNPAKNWVYGDFYKPWREGTLPAHRAFIPALVTNNPHISQHYIDIIERTPDKNLRERPLNGNWEYDDDPNALFETDALHDLFTNPVSGEGEGRYITCAAARLGRDTCISMVGRGWTCIHITSYDVSRLTQTEAEIERLWTVYGIPRLHVVVDEEGVGGSVMDHLAGVKGFIGGSPPIQDASRKLEAAQPGYTRTCGHSATTHCPRWCASIGRRLSARRGPAGDDHRGVGTDQGAGCGEGWQAEGGSHRCDNATSL